MKWVLGTCPECGAVAEYEDWGNLASTHGRLAMSRIRCIRRHVFVMPRYWPDSTATPPYRA